MDRNRVQEEHDELDRLSRERALTVEESLRLERAVCLLTGRRISKGLTKELARHGVRRAMHVCAHKDVNGPWPRPRSIATRAR